MKKIYYILLVLTLGVAFSSCEDDLLDKTPQDQISDPDFWKTEGDLQLYLNRLYNGLPGHAGSGATQSRDAGTDIILESLDYWGSTATARLDGTLNLPASGGGWGWTNVRNANYFLENADRVEPSTLSDHYIGEAHFFRAWYYFGLLKNFGDLPIITTVLSVDDEEILYGPRSPRSEVADFIIEDLDKAIAKMEVAGNVGPSRLNRDIAALFKARVCLYEGTWEKYHQGTVFAGDTDGSEYLRLAEQAADLVLQSNYSLATGDPATAYHKLFVQEDYSSNPEVMLYKHYDYETYNIFNTMYTHPNRQGMTHEMTKNYLCKDGLPTAASPLFVGDSTLAIVEVNRDPRLEQSIMVPGELDYVSVGGDSTFFSLPYMPQCPTGYELQKWRTDWLNPAEPDKRTRNLGYIIFRYAEALLIYAEAKAELGTLEQNDVDMTINKLRDRVGMPHLVLASITDDPNWPNYGSTLTPAIYEVRRERVVELYAEGFRLDDLMRWRAHSLIVGNRFTGTKYTDDIKAEYPNEKVNADGYLDPYVDYLNTGYYGFSPDRDYLLPLPTNELTINPNLDQNPGW